MPLKSIDSVEIFSIGTHNGDKYTEKDLDSMVFAFDETKDKFRPYLKLSHNKDQQLLSEEELPAAGYISNLYRKGKKLIADFVDIPEKIYFLMKNKAYSKRSSEIYWGIDFAGKKYERMLKAVAILGADMPAVHNLDDIINMYGFDPDKKNPTEKITGGGNFKKYQVETIKRDDSMPEEIKEYQKKLSAAESEKAELEKKLKDQKDKIEEQERKYAQIEIERESERVKNYANSLVSEKLACKSMVPLIEKILGPEEKNYSVTQTVKNGEKEEDVKKEYSNKQDMLKECLSLFSSFSKLSFTEQTTASKGDEGKKKDKEDELEEKINKYAQENKVSYSEAYKNVMYEESQKEGDE